MSGSQYLKMTLPIEWDGFGTYYAAPQRTPEQLAAERERLALWRTEYETGLARRVDAIIQECKSFGEVDIVLLRTLIIAALEERDND